jgi:arylsulfatase A-like enzyme
MLRFTVVALCALALCACGRAPAERSVLLVTFDTARVDLLGVYGGRGVTPRVDAFADSAVRFDRAFTTAPYTGPSHASLLTGQYPPRHGLRDYLEQALPASAETLAEMLRAHGYETAAFVSTYVLDARFGLDQGFGTYSSPPRSPTEPGHWRPGPQTVALALDWLRERDPARPFFLWLHLYDAHGPYMPPDRFRKPLAEDVQPGSPDARRQRYYEQAGVLDEEFGRLLDAAEAVADPDELIVVVVSDHGELLGEYGRKLAAHSNALVDTTIRVPLLLRIPGRTVPGVRSDAVSVIDVLPTIVAALALPLLPGVEGRSLLELPPPGDVRPTYSETFYEFFARSEDGSELVSVRDERFALLAHADRDELFDLATDPAEQTDVSRLHPERLRDMRAALARLRSGWATASPDSALELDDAERADHLERLRALGYVE